MPMGYNLHALHIHFQIIFLVLFAFTELRLSGRVASNIL